ncbi:MAG TPA: hypothetical protein VIX41_13790 [Acidimicrobiales bacterium]
MTTNEADRIDDRGPATEVFPPDEAIDEPEADEIEEGDDPRLAAEADPSGSEESEAGPVGRTEDDTVVAGDPSHTGRRSGVAEGDAASGVDGPLLADAAGYQDRWYEIQTGFVDEPRHAVQSAGELLAEMMDDLTRRLTTELGAFDARPGAGDDVSTEDLRVSFQRYRSFFDRLLAA